MPGRRSWVGWLAENRLVAAGLAAALVIAIVGIVVAVNRGGDGTPIAVGTEPGPVSTGPGATTGGATTGTVPTSPGATLPPGATPTAGTTGGTTGSVTTGGTTGGTTTRPVTATCKPVQPKAKNGQNETGVFADRIEVAQIVSDSSNLPAQLRPNYEGLLAYFKRVNDAGGVCSRKLVVNYENDNSFPATHRYEQLAQSNFAFVANSSLIDSTDYETSPPFNPAFTDERTDEFVPDVGGLAYSYGRSQSNWHAGVVGSISPVMVGGGAFKGMVDHARSKGRSCTRMGLLYLIEPTGASEDQARLGQRSFEESWGANLGRGNTQLYQASLASPVQVYRGIVRNMLDDGMNCFGTYADLGSNVNLVIAAAQEGAWPTAKCADANRCFKLAYMPFSGYDPKFIRDVEAGAAGASKDVYTFLPHLPLGETSDPAMKRYLADLAACRKAIPDCRDAEPSSFGIIGYASGIMFVEALKACGAAPTRACVMTYLRGLKGFVGNDLLGAVTPFKCTKARDGSSHNYGVWCWKWIFTNTVTVQVLGNESDLIKRFHRVRPLPSGFSPDTLKIARGSPA